jgi:hypothetical protein
LDEVIFIVGDEAVRTTIIMFSSSSDDSEK